MIFSFETVTEMCDRVFHNVPATSRDDVIENQCDPDAPVLVPPSFQNAQPKDGAGPLVPPGYKNAEQETSGPLIPPTSAYNIGRKISRSERRAEKHNKGFNYAGQGEPVQFDRNGLPILGTPDDGR